MNKIEEAMKILNYLGLPVAQQNERSALTLLALLNLKAENNWNEAVSIKLRIHDIILFIQANYGKTYAENSRETIRRQTLHQFVQASLVFRNHDDPSRPTNSPNTNYIITEEALKVIKNYGNSNWDSESNMYLKLKGKLSEKYDKKRNEYMLVTKQTNGGVMEFSPGEHNELQIKIIEIFKEIFIPNSIILYVGDSARKLLYFKEDLLNQLKIPISTHEKLPDVVFYDKEKNYIYLVEAVTSHGPLSPKRQMELEESLKDCKAKRVYISAFPDFKEFKKHIDNIAWETEVWILEKPEHLIHFNGNKFCTIYK
ncbi:MAG: BsuBI/PstI family type II restriction endonuclease [Candidatus Humimicrobiaceae bacterium]